MRLVKLKLRDYRRFAGEHSLDLNEDLIALVGPNEAGKSSLLTAVEFLSRGSAGGSDDVTRGRPGPASIAGLYVLETEDRALLVDIPGGPDVTHVWVKTETAGGQVWQVEPYPSRDLTPRGHCRDLLDGLKGDPGLDPRYSAEGRPWDPDLLVRVRQLLASNTETLREDSINAFGLLADRLQAVQFPLMEDMDSSSTDDGDSRASLRNDAASALVTQAELERRPAPARRVLEALSGHTPQAVFFDEPHRVLEAEYVLAEIAQSPPAALKNLCDLAELDLSLAQSDLTQGRRPHLESVFEQANARLKARFQAAWTQSTVYPRLSTPLDGILRILVSTERGDYSFPRERSDGLRWFMALQAFLVARGGSNLILLIDEAETHLHYDAQADLIDALMTQNIAAKVVYTTHSVGCLPPDLGCGIRAVLAEKDSESSRVSNSYWSVDPVNDEKIGYTPLLFAMGARMLSLTIPRYGVVGEGPCEAILMPSLLRESAEVPRLSYRVVPGLSELAEAQVGSLMHHAGNIVVVTDDDDGGRAIRSKLVAGGFPSDSIFDLSRFATGCTLEDLVAPDVLASAINDELQTWSIGTLRVAPEELPAVGRWTWLVERGRADSVPIERLSKTRVAQRVVDIGRRHGASKPKTSIIDPQYVDGMRRFHEELSARLDIRTPTGSG